MIPVDQQQVLRSFQEIPGVGKSIAQDFWNIGVRSMDEIKRSDPETLYQQMCAYEGVQIDRCLLYVMRCAVYYASHEQHEPDLLKWWNWSDKNIRKAELALNEITG
jgi:hypothetical protein